MIALEAELFATPIEPSQQPGGEGGDAGFEEELTAALEQPPAGDPVDGEEALAPLPPAPDLPAPSVPIALAAARTGTSPAAVDPAPEAPTGGPPRLASPAAGDAGVTRLPAERESAPSAALGTPAAPTATPTATSGSDPVSVDATRPAAQAPRDGGAETIAPVQGEARQAAAETSGSIETRIAAPIAAPAPAERRPTAIGIQPPRARERTGEVQAADSDRVGRLEPETAARLSADDEVSRPGELAAAARPNPGSAATATPSDTHAIGARPGGIPTAPAPPAPTPSGAPASPTPAIPMAPEAVPLQAEWLAQRGGGTARVELHPPHLGRVELEVRMRGSDVEIVVAVQEGAAQSPMLAQRDPLADALASRDLRLASFDVVSDEPETSREGFERGDRDSADGEANPTRETGELRLVRSDRAVASQRSPASGIDVRI